MLSKDNAGAIRLFLEGLGKFEANYTRLIGEERLKKLDTVNAFFEALERADKKMTKDALAFRIANGPNEERTPMQDLREQVSRSRDLRVSC